MVSVNSVKAVHIGGTRLGLGYKPFS